MTVTYQQRSVWDGLRRGFFGHCPNCGAGKLFRAYLKVVPACPSCGHALEQYRADDGPAYFTILIVGHLMVAPLLLSEAIYTWPLMPLLVLFASGIVTSTLALLPRVKGAFVGVQWAIGDSGGAHGTESRASTVSSTDIAG